MQLALDKEKTTSINTETNKTETLPAAINLATPKYNGNLTNEQF